MAFFLLLHLPLLNPIATAPQQVEPEPSWSLPEVHSCTRCHRVPGDQNLALQPHAPSLMGGWYRPDFVTDYLTRHGRGPTPQPFLPEDGPQRSAALEQLQNIMSSIALRGSSINLDIEGLEVGRQLYHSVGCVACHGPYEDAETLSQPLWEFEELFSSEARDIPFTDLATKFGMGGLAAFLESPGGHGPTLRLEPGEARQLANFIWLEELGRSGAQVESGGGLMYEYYEGRFKDSLLEGEGRELVRRGVVPAFELVAPREDDFAFRFTGFIEIERSGFYTFTTRSDDGSWLWIGGELVVENGGLHAPIEKHGQVRLDSGRHPIEVRFFERSGGAELGVFWEGPGLEREPIPAEVLSHRRISVPTLESDAGVSSSSDPRLLEALGCSACHDPGRMERLAKPWGSLEPSRGGCLDSSTPGVPRYDFDQEEREGWARRIGKVSQPPPQEHLGRLLEARGCSSCHSRGGRGGPSRELMSYFQVDSHAELGDEGRIPPHLDGLGSKLHAPWLEEVLREGARSRPYMQTRMPAFPEEAKVLTRLFQELDATDDDLLEPEFDLDLVPIGRDLVGTGGLGCIQCHELAGYPSLGVPAVDLARVHERVKPGWFKQLLLDPIAINMNTRMPTFWTDGKSPIDEHFDGDPARQIDAIWAYLSLGNSMPLPEGLVAHESDYELNAAQRPTLVSVFGKGLSPRTLFVGYPERVHVAFDVDNSRLALAWRGRFFNAQGTWHGRAGALEEPWGEDRLELPAGPPFAKLGGGDAPWPTETGRDAGYRVLGRSFDEERRPIFRYALEEIEIEERIVPRLGRQGGRLVREFQVKAPTPVEGLYFRAAAGSEARVVVGGAQLRKVNEESRVPVQLAREGESYWADFSVEVNW